MCDAVGGNSAVTGFGKYDNKYSSFNAMSPLQAVAVPVFRLASATFQMHMLINIFR